MKKNKSGFTFLEIIIVIGLFLIIGTITTSILTYSSNESKNINSKYNISEENQFTINFIKTLVEQYSEFEIIYKNSTFAEMRIYKINHNYPDIYYSIYYSNKIIYFGGRNQNSFEKVNELRQDIENLQIKVENNLMTIDCTTKDLKTNKEINLNSVVNVKYKIFY